MSGTGTSRNTDEPNAEKRNEYVDRGLNSRPVTCRFFSYTEIDGG